MQRGILAVIVMLLVGAGAALDKEPNDGLDVWFRDTDLGALANQEVPVYPDIAAGDSELIERAFPGAPPVISHTTEDMLPIMLDDNECLNCHHPENAIGKKDLPLSKSHFEKPVMAKGKGKNPMLLVVDRYEESADVGGHFNCTMCHAPAATNVRTPATSFVTEKEPKK